MARSRGRIPAVAGAVALTVGGFAGALAFAGPAAAAACSGQVRYAASTNTIYLTSGTVNLTQLKALCPGAPLAQSAADRTVWELSADLVIQNGAELDLHGTTVGGDVNQLRLRSLSSNAATEVSSITAQSGTIDISDTTLTSWDDAAQAPDTDPFLPAGSASTSRGRAFIRALSTQSADGTTNYESTLNIVNSDLGYLGYYGAESYGVAYKARGCDIDHQGVCNSLNVYGKQINSRFHNNFMGTYTFDAYGMTFSGSEYDHNYMYGLDPHDDSDYLTITNNKFHDNGDHGLICSQRCDHLTITGNESYNNGLVPYQGPNTDPDGPALQIHGIMLHRGVTDTVVANNYVHDNPSGAGIAIFDSSGDTIRDNVIANVKYGLRISVGSANNVFSNNTITNASAYGIYSYQGSDTPIFTTTSGRPTGNIFDNDPINGTGSNAIKFTSSDNQQVSNSAITNAGDDVRVDQASASFTNVTSGRAIDVRGVTGGQQGYAKVVGATAPYRISLDAYSTFDAFSPAGVLSSVESLTSTVTPTGSTLHLTSAQVGTNDVTVTPSAASARPATGSLVASYSATGVGTPGVVRHIVAKAVGSSASTTYTFGGLTPGKSYTPLRGGQPLFTTPIVADSNGRVAFTTTTGTGSTDYSIAGA